MLIQLCECANTCKDAYDVIKSLGTNTRKVGHNLFEVDMPNPKRPEEFVTLVVWDFSGRGLFLL